MKTLLSILLLFGIYQCTAGCCGSDDRTLTEMLFQGNAGTIFTCKILTFSIPSSPDGLQIISSDGSINATATAEIIKVYYGNVDTNIVILNAGSYLTIGEIYLIYTGGNGKVFGFGGNCDRWSKQVSNNPYAVNELLILNKFSTIFKNKETGIFRFTNSENNLISEGAFENGKPVNIWKHYYDNGIIKSEYDLKLNSYSQFGKDGIINLKKTEINKVKTYEQYSEVNRGKLQIKEVDSLISEGFEESKFYEYFENGNLKTLTSQINISVPGGTTSNGKTGEYREYYENGILKVEGQYRNNIEVGKWK